MAFSRGEFLAFGGLFQGLFYENRTSWAKHEKWFMLIHRDVNKWFNLGGRRRTKFQL